MFSEMDELEFLLANPICGGSPEGEGEGEGGGEAEGKGGEGGGEGEQHVSEGEAEGRDAGDTGRQTSMPGDKFIPKHRFDEVNTRFQQYKGLGSADEIKAKLARLEALEKQPSNRYTEERKKQIREDLLEVFPEIKNVLDTSKTQTETFVSTGVRQNETFLKEIGLEVNDENNHYLQELIGGVIARKPEYTSRFFARDTSVFGDAWKEVKSKFWPNAGRKVPGLDKIGLKKPAVTPANAGKKPAEAKEIKPGPLMERELLDDASERAFAMLDNQME